MGAHRFAAAPVDPAHPLRDICAFVDVIAELRVVLVDIQGEQRRVDGRVGVDSLSQIFCQHRKGIRVYASHLDINPTRPPFMLLQMWW